MVHETTGTDGRCLRSGVVIWSSSPPPPPWWCASSRPCSCSSSWRGGGGEDAIMVAAGGGCGMCAYLSWPFGLLGSHTPAVPELSANTALSSVLHFCGTGMFVEISACQLITYLRVSVSLDFFNTCVLVCL